MPKKKRIDLKIANDQNSESGSNNEPPSKTEIGSFAKIGCPSDSRKMDENSIDPTLASINYPIMPFHHLIPADLLRLDSLFTQGHSSLYQFGNSTNRKHLFWQALAAHGISAKEAALFDDSIECSFIEPNGNHLIQVNWEALHYSALEGCAELYLTEMFICKQRVYEAGDELPNSLEFSYDDLAAYLPEEIFKPPLVEKVIDLFFDSLSTSFMLTVSPTGDQLGKSSERGNPPLLADLFKSYLTQSSRRIKGNSTKSPANGKQTESYTVKLADYWRGWKTAAHLAKFDFELLKILTDARAVRFYELTKLWRVPRIDSTNSTKDKLPGKLEIEYEKFVSLMPLPRLTTEREVKRQIGELIKPLRKLGYIKSFTFKPDWRNNSIRSARLNFHFND